MPERLNNTTSDPTRAEQHLQLTDQPAQPGARPGRRVLSIISPRRISAIYLAIILFGYFTWRIPHLFLERSTWTTMLDQQAITIIVALATLIPVSAGVYDLSVAYTMGITSTITTLLISEHHIPWAAAAIIALGVGAVIGLVNAVLITTFKINPLIATLGTGTIIGALDLKISGGQSHSLIGSELPKLANKGLLGVTPGVYLALVIALIIWCCLEFAPVGRRLYATGSGIQASRLAGIPVRNYIVGSLLAAGLLGAVAGVLLTGQVGANTPGVGQGYLLPGFAAVFLGATQFKEGRVNAWGTVVAILALGIGTTGFDLVGVDLWIHDFFYGIALVVAMALSVWSKRSLIQPNGTP